MGLGALLADGIGDTVRIWLSTFHAEEEVKVAWEILKALKLRERGPVLIACPTCGSLQFDMDTVVAEIERRLEAYPDAIEVAVLGVRSMGSARLATRTSGSPGPRTRRDDFLPGRAAAERPDRAARRRAVQGDRRKYEACKRVERDEIDAAEGAQWFALIEAESAMTPSGSPRWRRPPRQNDESAGAVLRVDARLATAAGRSPLGGRDGSTRPSRRSPAAASAVPDAR